jgi:hypothetical protein
MGDRDTAGIHGLEIARKRVRKVPLKVCRYPKGKYDPAEMSRREAMRSIDRAIPAGKFFTRTLKERKTRFA